MPVLYRARVTDNNVRGSFIIKTFLSSDIALARETDNKTDFSEYEKIDNEMRNASIALVHLFRALTSLEAINASTLDSSI
jgi:hypothetical protein